MPKKVVSICDRIIEYSFYLLAVIVPLVLTPWNYELFEYNKMMVVYAATATISGAWAVKMVALKKPGIRRSPFDIFLLLFLVSQILSTLFSIDIHTSIWGYYSRFHGGLLSTISYVILFFAFTSNINSKKTLKNLLFLVLATAFVVCLYGILEHFGIDKNLWVQDVQNRVFSTLGQPNWLGAYIAVVIPVAIGILLFNFSNKLLNGLNEIQNSKFKVKNTFDILHKILPFDFSFLTLAIFILTLLFYITLLFTKSRSGVLGFWIANAVFGVLLMLNLFIKKTKKDLQLLFKKILLLFLILNSCFLILSFIIGGSGLWFLEKYTLPALTKKTERTDLIQNRPAGGGESILSTGVTESGDIRRIVWKGATDIFLHNPIFGSGVETFAYAYYQYRPAAHNMTSEWDFLYNKAHNEFLNYLANTGIVGFGTWMGFIIAYIVWVIKQCKMYNLQCTINGNKKGEKNSSQLYIVHSTLYIILGLFTGWLSILITDFLGFSVVVIGLFFILIPAACFVYVNLNQDQDNYGQPLPGYRNFNGKQAGIIFLIIAGVMFIEYYLFNLWRADTFFAKGYRQNRSMQFADSYGNLTQAFRMNPGEPYYADELAYSSAILAAAIAKDPKEATTAGMLSDQAAALSDKITSENPRNINYLKSKIRIFYALSQIDPQYKKVVLDTLEKAYRLAPTDPKIIYNLAVVMAQAGQTDKALSLFSETISLKPDFKDAYYGLGLLYKDMKKDDDAIKTLEFILKKLDPNDSAVRKKLEEWK